MTYDVSQAGPYGTLYVNSTTGAYTIVPDSGAINALKAPTTESFIITVSDGTLSANQTLTIAINGTNDAAIISGITAGSVGEAGGVTNATLGTTTASGTLTDTDVDDTPNTFTAVTSPTKSAGGYGTFTMTAAGVWTYTLNNANSAVQALNVGDTLTDSFTVTTIDGTPQVVTVTISGSNDAAIISGTATGSVIEAGAAITRHADRDRHAHRHRRRQSAQYLHGGQLADGERRRLRQLHDDGGWRVDLHAQQRQQRGAGAQCRQHADRHLHRDHHRRHRKGGDGHHQRHQRRGHHFRHHDRLGDRGRRRRQCHAGTPTATGTLTDTDVDNAAQYLYGGYLTNGKRRRLRHLHDDGGWRVDLHAQQRQQRGASAQCRRHADRQLHGDHRRRHRPGGDGHHQRQQRRRHHFRHNHRLS